MSIQFIPITIPSIPFYRASWRQQSLALGSDLTRGIADVRAPAFYLYIDWKKL